MQESTGGKTQVCSCVCCYFVVFALCGFCCFVFVVVFLCVFFSLVYVCNFSLVSDCTLASIVFNICCFWCL